MAECVKGSFSQNGNLNVHRTGISSSLNPEAMAAYLHFLYRSGAEIATAILVTTNASSLECKCRRSSTACISDSDSPDPRICHTLEFCSC